MRYVIGLLMIAFGVFMVWKTDWIMRTVGASAWAERKLGSGGSWAFYKGIGVILVLLAFIIMSGDIVFILDFFFGRR